MTKQQLNNIGNTKQVYRKACSSNPSEKKNKTYNQKNNTRRGKGGYNGGYNDNNQFGRRPNPDFKKRRGQPTNPTGPKSSGREYLLINFLLFNSIRLIFTLHIIYSYH